MTKSGKPHVIDGFSSVQAVRHAKEKQPDGTLPHPVPQPPSQKPAATLSTPVPKIGHSVIPAKYEITCYECQFVFVIQGRLIDSLCPKCHVKLVASTITIDHDWSENVRTIGQVILTPAAKLIQASIITRDLTLACDASRGSLVVHNRLELCTGARFNTAATRIRDLSIRQNAVLRFEEDLSCQNLEVTGELHANVHCAASATVEAGGFLQGTLWSPRLILKEGARLNATLHIGDRR